MRRIWTLRRLKKLGFNDNFLLDVYKKEIRTVLEYAVQVWNGALTKKDSDRIERVQKIVLKFLLRQKYNSYTDACENFGLQKLSARREQLCSKFVLKEYKKDKDFFQKVRKTPKRAVAKKKFVHEPKTRSQRHYSSCYVYLTRKLNKILQSHE